FSHDRLPDLCRRGSHQPRSVIVGQRNRLTEDNKGIKKASFVGPKSSLPSPFVIFCHKSNRFCVTPRGILRSTSVNAQKWVLQKGAQRRPKQGKKINTYED